MSDTIDKVTYWHRELPPFEAEIVGEHTVEATSSSCAWHHRAPG